jgi:hypothetical protein
MSSVSGFARRVLQSFCLSAIAVCLVSAQTKDKPPLQPGTVSNEPPPCEASEEPMSKRVLGIIPNYRTSPCLVNFKPLSSREKYKIASQDAFDRGTFVLALAFAGESQLTNANRAFGQGVSGYAQYFGTAYGDFVIGDLMTEGVFPSVLHQDPRYFRYGRGGVGRRMGYAVGQIFWTHNDSGSSGFNYSEVVGNSAAVAISESYYVNERDAYDASIKLASQLGVDAAANVLKEFWPDILRKFARH